MTTRPPPPETCEIPVLSRSGTRHASWSSPDRRPAHARRRRHRPRRAGGTPAVGAGRGRREAGLSHLHRRLRLHPARDNLHTMCVCMCKLSHLIAYYSSFNMWAPTYTDTGVRLSWSGVAAWVDKFIETELCPLLFVVAFRHRAHLVVVRVQVRRGQVEVVCTRAGGCKKQGDEKKAQGKIVSRSVESTHHGRETLPATRHR